MLTTKLILAATWVFIAAMVTIEPWLARKNVLFGVVFGNGDFWQKNEAKRILRTYVLVMLTGFALITALCLAYLFAAGSSLSVNTMTAVYFAGIAALLVYGMAAFIFFHAKAAAYKAHSGPDESLVKDRIVVEAGLSDRQTVLPASWLLLLLPVLLAALAVALIGYPSMPARIPTHYGFTGADAWAPKSWGIVLFPTILAAFTSGIMLICALMTRRAPASVRGNPDAAPGAFRFRKYMIVLMLLIGVFVEITSLIVEIGFLTQIPPIWFELSTLLFIPATVALFYIYFRYVRVRKSKGPILDDDARWALGMFYFNPSDPSCFIEKRSGIGYTLNFAKPLSWVLLLGILGFVVGTIVFSFTR